MALDRKRPLGIDHLPLLEALLAKSARSPSEYSIANLYLYRHRHDYRLVEGAYPYLLGRTYDGERHAMPLGPLDPQAAWHLLKGADCIFPLDKVEAFALAGQSDLIADERAEDADYIYAADRLAALMGAKTKRAQASEFARLSPSVGPCDMAAARAVLNIWLAQAARGSSHADAQECTEAIDLVAKLQLDGITVMLNREPVGFLLASPARSDERIVHFAKARRDIKGIYPWMFAHYAEIAGVDRLNFEQDLGNPGLAQAPCLPSSGAQNTD